MKSFSKYNITIRLVEERDAEIIIEMRTDEKKSRFISSTSKDIEAQREWLKKYKEREKDGTEYYFIATDEHGEDFATYRVYDILSGLPEIGSWVSKPNYNKPKNSIKVDVIMKDFVFSELKFDRLKFEVRRENKSVVRYHKLFQPIVTSETERDIFFILEKKTFYENLKKVLKNL